MFRVLSAGCSNRCVGCESYGLGFYCMCGLWVVACEGCGCTACVYVCVDCGCTVCVCVCVCVWAVGCCVCGLWMYGVCVCVCVCVCAVGCCICGSLYRCMWLRCYIGVGVDASTHRHLDST